ncbi:MAG TPA: exodeoxyribonuclease VII large subunit [Candidatus Saccharibacteria bacterium]|nr:exodeoxyribonuclease VII large subunit [Candidatus Saccharibacteria bacterium]
METIALQVSEAIAYINQTLDYAYPTIVVEGEVSSFKVNQNKYVFFDIKDDSGTLGCFMSVYQLRTQLEDGMKVRVVANPKLTNWGKFSLNIRDVKPVGEGSLKRAFELLRAKLEKEGLFAVERKRELPVIPTRIGVISSTNAAGYADFVKILSERWGGVELIVAHTQVQGMDAPRQMIGALEYFNQMAEPVDVVAIVRGGGSADDLAAFNDEPLVRAIAASRVPTIVGVGHEVDVSLADMAADVRAATPSNAAQILVPDKQDVRHGVTASVRAMVAAISSLHTEQLKLVTTQRQRMAERTVSIYERLTERHTQLAAVLSQLDPRSALKRGYALVFDESGKPLGNRSVKIGQKLRLETNRYVINTGGVEDVTEKLT